MGKIASASRLTRAGIPDLPIPELTFNAGRKPVGHVLSEGDEGLPYTIVKTNASADTPAVFTGGVLKSNNLHTLGNVAIYINQPLEGNLQRIGACFRFRAGSAGSAFAMGSWTTASGSPQTGSIHFSVHPTGYSLGRTNAGSLAFIQASGVTSFAIDQWVTAEVFLDVAGARYWVRTPDNLLHGPFTGAEATTGAAVASPAAFWELIHTATGQMPIEVRSWWADSRQYRMPGELTAMDIADMITAQSPTTGAGVYTAASTLWVPTTSVTAPGTTDDKIASCIVTSSGKAMVDVNAYYEKGTGAHAYLWSVTSSNPTTGQSLTLTKTVLASGSIARAVHEPPIDKSFLFTGLNSGLTNFYLRHYIVGTAGTGLGMRVDNTGGKELVITATPIR